MVMKMEAQTNRIQLVPADCIFILINIEPSSLTIDSRDAPVLIRNAISLAKIAKCFEIPTIMTTIGVNTFGGPLLPQLQMIYPNEDPIECNTLSIWENRTVICSTGEDRPKKNCYGRSLDEFLRCPFCHTSPSVGWIRSYIVSDACAELNDVDNDFAIERMIEAGAVSLDCSRLLVNFQAYPSLNDSDTPDSGLIREFYYT